MPRTVRPGCPILPRTEQLDKCMPIGINFSRGWRNLLVHAGGIWGWKNGGPKTVSQYSLGMRQRLFQEFGNASTSPEPRILLTPSEIPDSMWEQFKYCLAPAGDGFGIRMAKSAALNCVPLIAQPYVVQAFEDLLPYERFSLRLEFDQVPRLPAILLRRGISQMVRRLLHTAISPLRDQYVAPTQPRVAPHMRAPAVPGVHTHATQTESPLKFAGLAYIYCAQLPRSRSQPSAHSSTPHRRACVATWKRCAQRSFGTRSSALRTTTRSSRYVTEPSSCTAGCAPGPAPAAPPSPPRCRSPNRIAACRDGILQRCGKRRRRSGVRAAARARLLSPPSRRTGRMQRRPRRSVQKRRLWRSLRALHRQTAQRPRAGCLHPALAT